MEAVADSHPPPPPPEHSPSLSLPLGFRLDSSANATSRDGNVANDTGVDAGTTNIAANTSKSIEGSSETRKLAISKPLKSLQPPENFSNVAGLIYRSSFPRPENFSFLQRLRLKSIVVLIPEPYPKENTDFLIENNIKFHQVPISGNKEPFINIPQQSITEILKIVLNPENHPLLIHCNRGKHRTGCLVGCIRKLQNWSLTMIFDEYRRFALPKVRALDQQFIELYEDNEIINLASKNHWLPISW